MRPSIGNYQKVDIMKCNGSGYSWRIENNLIGNYVGSFGHIIQSTF